MSKVTKVKANSRATKGKQHDQETLNELKQAFKIFDSKNTGEIDARQLKAIMKAFGMEIKKQDVRDIYAELGKEIKEGLSFNEFLGVMTSRMVSIVTISGATRLQGRDLQGVQAVRRGQPQQDHLQESEENRGRGGRENPRRRAEGDAGGGRQRRGRHAQLRGVLSNHEEKRRSPRRFRLRRRLIFHFILTYYQELLNRKMWNSKDSNKIIGTHMKVQSYKNHLSNLKKAKSQLGISAPWKPSFSLSKRKNKYHKFVEKKIERQNQVLLSRMLQIQSQPMTNTCINIPLSIPSNKVTYATFKQRERRLTNHGIDKQNRKILSKIEGATSDYGKHVWSQNWKLNEKYKDNIVKKQYVPDYKVLAKEDQNLVKSRQRPHTAFVH